MTARTTLPRSLVPLPGEGLAGYVLRLGHRTDRSPARILHLTGADGKHKEWAGTTARLLLALPAAGQASLAATAQVTAEETAGFTLSPLASQYPPVAESLLPRSQDGMLTFDNWVYSKFTRYCPQCLAGDGSPIQQRHGGPWRIRWRLPVVFSCLTHQAFLHADCPHCRLPVHVFRNGGPSRILPALTCAGLHPAQCRNIDNRHGTVQGRGRQHTLCGARLDGSAPARTIARPAADDLALQIYLDSLLDLRHDSIDASRTFADLRVLTAVISATWPRAAEFARDTSAADAVDDHVEHMRKTLLRSKYTWDRPPTDAAATAAVLHIGRVLLGLDAPDLRHALRSLLTRSPQPTDHTWGRTWRRLEAGGSSHLRQGLEPAAVIRPAARTFADGPTAPSRSGGYRPEHVPQCLPENWYRPLLDGPFEHHAERHLVLRRTAAVRLVQLPTGMAMAQAADYLGIPNTWLRYTLGTHRGGGPHLAKDPFAFDDAVEAIARFLDALPYPVDYQHRRTRLKDWALGQTEWDEIRSQLPKIGNGKYRPKLDPHKRQCASTFIWTAATQSERALAPLVPDAPTDPAFRETWRTRAGSLYYHLVHSEGLYYKALRGLLADYATGLAQDTDTPRPSQSSAAAIPPLPRWEAGVART
ncbi:TniQ family protein [Streptomyces sp. NPDC057617]|uniref:TniQ family protein n=1 Tax=Streptomyces sp. NPDC057617 TaxID=3346184 RepID=UPI0036ABE5BF